jgi:hypothetical protein
MTPPKLTVQEAFDALARAEAALDAHPLSTKGGTAPNTTPRLIAGWTAPNTTSRLIAEALQRAVEDARRVYVAAYVDSLLQCDAATPSGP